MLIFSSVDSQLARVISVNLRSGTIIQDLEIRLDYLENDSSLFEADQLLRRIEALDELEAYLSYAGSQDEESCLNRRAVCKRAESMRARLEAANTAVYRSIRSEIRHGGRPEQLRQWIEQHKGAHVPGLGYDDLDEIVSGVLQLRQPSGDLQRLTSEMVFYQPTPARHIFHMIKISGLSEADVLIDFGAGLGHVSLLTSILAGNRSIGIELEPAYVASAREAALSLGLSRVTFVRQDARESDLSEGTVFYLYTPFSGAILRDVLDQLRKQSEQRHIRVCTLGPCTASVAEETWLKASTPPSADHVVCFHSLI